MEKKTHQYKIQLEYFSLLLFFFFWANILFAQNKQYILALSKGDSSLIVLDYQTLKAIKSIPISSDPHEIVTNREGTEAYISHPVLTGIGSKINVVDLKNLNLKRTIDTKPFYTPHGLSFQSNKLWVTVQGSKAVVLLDLKTDRVEQVFGTGQDFTHLISVRNDGLAFYTTNVESGTVSVYEKKDIAPYMPPTGVLPPNAKMRSEWRQDLIEVGLGAEGFDISRDGKELWTARPDGHIIVVDLEKKLVKHDINRGVLGLHRLKITPDGNSVCIVSVKTGELLYYNRATLQFMQKQKIGRGAGIFMDAEQDRMFISCTPDNYIAVIDLKSRQEIKRISIARPDGVTAVEVLQ